jgi:hypothetical protein
MSMFVDDLVAPLGITRIEARDKAIEFFTQGDMMTAPDGTQLDEGQRRMIAEYQRTFGHRPGEDRDDDFGPTTWSAASITGRN